MNVVKKTVPKYNEWLNSAFSEKIIVEDSSKDDPASIKVGGSGAEN